MIKLFPGKQLLLLVLFTLPQFVPAQTLLPTFYSFDAVNAPNGWTTYLDVVAGSYTYSGGSDASPSCRLDGTGEYVQIFFSDEPDSLVYNIRATAVTPPAASPGTLFTVQQSPNGTSWTTVRVFDTNNLTGTFVEYTDLLLSGSRYVRFFYTNKVSGSNIALDEIRIGRSDPGPNPAIAVYHNSTRIANGGTVYISSTGTHPLVIENEGTVNTLNISGNSLSGSAAADYSVSGMPLTVSAQNNATFDLNFNPALNGTRPAILSIQSNDANDPVFTIHIYGISGGLASEPAEQATSLVFTGVVSYDYTYSFTAPSSQPENYIVLRKSNAVVTEIPADGMSYTTGDVIGNAEVEYVGPAGTFIPDYAYANNTYHYAIFAFNGPEGYENYLSTNPLTGNISTTNVMIGSYYNGLNCLSSGFINALHNKINPHNWIYYSSYASTMIEEFEEHDTINGKKTVMCQYSGYHYLYEPPFVWDSLSREHVFSHSWFPTSPATNEIEYSDLHNLFPAQLEDVNIPRSNHPMGYVVNPTHVFGDGMLGTDLNGNTVYEPRDEIKGNIARAMFYMTVCYNGSGGFTWTLPPDQDQQILKDWHFQDLPDNYEYARNDYVHATQGNRNPFVDSIHYACYIDFSTMTRIANPAAWCVLLDTDEDITDEEPLVYPNPGNGFFDVNIFQPETVLSLYDANGRRVLHTTLLKQGKHRLDLSQYNKGLYILIMESEGKSRREKLILH